MRILNPIYALHWHLSKARDFPEIHSTLRQFREEGLLAPLAWHERQTLRLRRLLSFAADHVPYYKRLFRQSRLDPASMDLPSAIKHLPILTKDLVREHQDELIAENVDRAKIVGNATGGSTGAPLKFFQDMFYGTIAAAADAYVREWSGIKPYDRAAWVWGADRDFNELSLRERFYQWRTRSRSLNAFRMSDQSLLRFCRMLARWRPPYLLGYSSALEALASCARKNGLDTLRFTAIRSSAETLWPHQRTLIETTFNSPVLDFYGSREVNNLAAECPEERQLHLISPWRYVEIADEAGSPMPDGNPGYILVTDLSNYAMPFIRYRNEDVGRLSNDPCSCGRPSPILKELLGRSTDLICTSRGDIIHGEFFTHLFYGRDDIRRFQVHQTSLNHVVVRYVPIGPPPTEYMQQVAEKIRQRLGEDVTVEVEHCEEIPVPPSGKHRFTLSDVNALSL